MLHKILHHPWLEPLRGETSSHIGFLILRVAVGTAFMYHGYPKLFGNPAMVVNFFNNIHIPFASFFAPFVGCVEFFGGALLILGFGVRAIAAMLAFDMFIAILQAKGLASWKGIELETVLMASAIALLLSGAGDYSVDAALMARSRKEHEASMPMKTGPAK